MSDNNTDEGTNPWANEYTSKSRDESAAAAPRLGLPDDFGSLSLDSSHENNDEKQHQAVSAADDGIWNLDQAAWADAPSSSQGPASPPEASSSAGQPTTSPSSDESAKAQAPKAAPGQPASGLRDDATPPSASNKPSLSPLPALNLDSFKQVFSSSASQGDLLTPASATEAQPVSPDREVSRQSSEKQPNPSGSGTPVTSASTLRPVPSSSTQTFAEAPFDFRRFQQQMSSKPAAPLAKETRAFLKEFRKKRLSLNDQIKAINDFLDDIANKMRGNEIWANASEKEFDNAVEAMEKQIMNNLYPLTFTPVVAEEQPSANILSDDLERDQVLSQRVKLFNWIKEEHLDLPEQPPLPSPEPLNAQQMKSIPPQNYYMIRAKAELLDINRYKSPRDKLITILNTCKLIFLLIRHSFGEEAGADTFIPYLILVLLRANPPHLVSNVQYIQRFRNPERLSGEAGYYLSSLNGAITFIESMDHSSLSNINQDEFEHQLEQAVSDLQMEEQHAEESRRQSAALREASNAASGSGSATPTKVDAADQDATAPRPFQFAARESMDFITRSSDLAQKTMSKPLSAISKIISDLGDPSEESPRSAPGPALSPHSAEQRGRRGYNPLYYPGGPSQGPGPRPRLHPQQRSDYLPDSATPESIQAQVDNESGGQQKANLNTLESMFPQIDGEVREAVLSSCQYDLGKAVDVLLEMGA